MSDVTTVNCPTCNKLVIWGEQSPFRPFCSKRCQLIDLGEWGVFKRAEGHASLADVPAVQIDGVSHLVLCWHRAVGALAKAELSETHRDYDATASGERKNEGLDDSIIQLRRDGHDRRHIDKHGIGKYNI